MDIGMMNDVARLKKTFVFSPTKKDLITSNSFS